MCDMTLVRSGRLHLMLRYVPYLLHVAHVIDCLNLMNA